MNGRMKEADPGTHPNAVQPKWTDKPKSTMSLRSNCLRRRWDEARGVECDADVGSMCAQVEQTELIEKEASRIARRLPVCACQLPSTGWAYADG